MKAAARKFAKLCIVLIVLAFQFTPSTAQLTQLEEGRAAISAGDYAKAMELLEPLADSGDAVAQNAMGVLYLQGWSVASDPERAVRYFQLSAKQGNSKGSMNLAHAYRTGSGVNQSCIKALDLLMPYADNGNAEAQARVGMIYDSGCKDLAPDPKEAFRWYSKAAAQDDPYGLGNLAAMYGLGLGVDQNYPEAMRYYRKAADLGNGKAAYNLGRMYEFGEGMPPDAEQAKYWYRKAVSLGEVEAEQRLMLLEGGENTATVNTVLLDEALKAPPIDLAQSYGSISNILEMLPLVEAGATLQLPDGEVNKANVATVRAELEQRLAVYGQAIAKRGSISISGEYEAKAKKCSKSASAWAMSITEGYDRIFVEQIGPAVTFEASRRRRHNSPEFTATGFCVENAISLIDPMNSDYVLNGELYGEHITIRPDVESILRAWPDFVKPPNRSNLSSCVVVLTPVGYSGKPLSAEIYDDADTFTPPAGKGIIFIHRAKKFMASEMKFRVELNDTFVGLVAPNEYYRLELEQGKYVVTVRSSDIAGNESMGNLEIALEPDEASFIEVEPKAGWKAIKISVEEVPAEPGQRLMRDGEQLN